MDLADVLAMAADLASRREPFVMVTVIATEGSTPRDPGARMLWTPDGGFFGTIGGGQFEELSKDAVERCFAERTSAVERFVLGADADQCCGGVVDVSVEFIGPRARAVIFGAGHVARALAGLVRPAAVELVIVDDREEWNNAERFAGCRLELDFDRGVTIARERPDTSLACVMTCSHDRDFEILRSLLDGEIPAYIGLIGSKSKRACFRTRLAGAGIAPERIERVRCPMGLGDMGKAPELVAVSIAGELLLEAKTLDAV